MVAMVPRAALATMMQTPRPPCSAPHRPAPGDRRGFRRPRASRGPLMSRAEPSRAPGGRAGAVIPEARPRARPRGLPRPGRLGLVGLGWQPASWRPVTRAARARAAPVRPGARAPSGASAVPAGFTSPLARALRGRAPLARARRARVPRTGPLGRTRRGRPPGRASSAGNKTLIPPAPPRRAGSGRDETLIPPRAPPEHRAAAPERGRAAWLRVRRRTACSGEFRAIVGRS